MPQVIELDKMEEKIIEMDSQIPNDPWVKGWISDFGTALIRGFKPGLSREAFVTTQNIGNIFFLYYYIR